MQDFYQVGKGETVTNIQSIFLLYFCYFFQRFRWKGQGAIFFTHVHEWKTTEDRGQKFTRLPETTTDKNLGYKTSTPARNLWEKIKNNSTTK